MHVLNFLNTHKDWEQLISKPPYNIKVSRDGEYVLLKYNQIDSDFHEELVRECRGSIFKQDSNGIWRYVCRPFDKFFNYGEEFASEIDWNSAVVTEKVDGSLCKCWSDNGIWHLSTNGTIDAFKAKVNDMDITFGEIFERALGVPIQKLYEKCVPGVTYMFELTSPETRVVIPYDDGIYFLAKRSTESGDSSYNFPRFQFEGLNIKFPEVYNMSSLENTIKAAELLSKDEEGFVVNDIHGNRIKVKSPEYLKAAHIRFNGQMTEKRIFSMMKEDMLDDLLAYFPDFKPMVDSVEEKINVFDDVCNTEWRKVRKMIAMAAKKNPLSAWLFYKLDHPDAMPRQFLFEVVSKDEKALELVNSAVKIRGDADDSS